jgi:hypothetical protein
MKKQIRKSIFETNSSTTHALVLSNFKYKTFADVKANVEYQHKIKIDPNFDVWQDEFKTFEDKINYLFYCTMTFESTKGALLKFLCNLSKLGIELVYENDDDIIEKFESTYVEIRGIMLDTVLKEDVFIDYLFGDSRYDSCCDEYEDILAWTEMIEKEKESGKRVILSERC